MKTRIKTIIHKSAISILRLALVSSLATPTPIIEAGQHEHEHAASALGYDQFLGCVSGPDHGAMGVHYVNGPLVVDGLIDVSRPEALIYEPLNGRLRLVGVEFIVDA